jgi:hypothetical protein
MTLSEEKKDKRGTIFVISDVSMVCLLKHDTICFWLPLASFVVVEKQFSAFDRKMQ